MRIAVFNAGSSSVKFKLFDSETMEVLKTQQIQNIGEKGSRIKNHHDAFECLDLDFSSLDAIGHRVVQGGEIFSASVLIDEKVEALIESLICLAPLHNPANLEGIKLARLKNKNIPQIAVFDTAFHASMPKEAYLYALPYEMYEKHGIRRFGFHGSSHAYIAREAAFYLNKKQNSVNLITLHLGNGASACAIQKGLSIDTSMGFTPLEGLVMGSRSGDIDPAIVLYMQRELGLSVNEVDTLLNKNAGLRGICDENDVSKIVNSDDTKAKLALDMMIRRIQKYIGSYMALLGTLDAVVFSGGVGENSSYIRERVMSSEMFKNIKYFVIKTDEELEILNECIKILKR